ncbi:hypothetical protein [Nocardioides sp. SLBN-35]|uniref:hypothetical protein n=1 Tax=Nocardioides sp. SLBN-35 TaxID=2768445 RepID=UPI0011546D84|nr:hypothetical protein [Nocardioides sp. SLBN-35]TQK73370.1 hypothetical protein FBY23_5202 [Nocardioides sp. SLBN-35]
MSNFAPKRTDYDTGDDRWNRDGIRSRAHGVSVTTASFKPANIGADGLVKSGSLVAGEGLLKHNLVIKAGETHLVSVIHETTCDRRYLPAALSAAEETSLKGVVFINGVVPA